MKQHRLNKAPVGHIYLRRGRPMVRMPDHPRASSNGYLEEHIVIAEKALGRPLPLTVEVHHVNEDRGDNANSNLVICQDKGYHKLLHARTKIVRAGGHPDRDRVCSSCGQVKPKDAFATCREKWDGRANECRLCARARHAATAEETHNA